MRAGIGLAILVGLATACGGGATPRERAAATTPANEPTSGEAAAMGDEAPAFQISGARLRRASPGTVELTLVVENVAGEGPPVAVGAAFAADDRDRDSIADVFLAQADGRKRYYVLRDASGRPVCSRAIPPVAPGERRELWARFPAPPDDIEALDVHLPALEPLRQVPIS